MDHFDPPEWVVQPLKRRPAFTNKPDELPSDTQELKALVMEPLEENAYLKRMLFGDRNEKLVSDPNQGLLFASPESQEDEV